MAVARGRFPCVLMPAIAIQLKLLLLVRPVTQFQVANDRDQPKGEVGTMVGSVANRFRICCRVHQRSEERQVHR